jgi:predicted GNAT family N-acyltransferase
MNPSAVRILHPETEEEWNSYFSLRYEVLRKPWDQPESSTKDDSEERSVHWLITDETGNAIAAGRLQLNSESEGQIRSMAVRTDAQGWGLGSMLIDVIEIEAARRNLKTIVLDAREPAVGFYLKHGYEITGESYLLFGQIPHKAMKKVL